MKESHRAAHSEPRPVRAGLFRESGRDFEWIAYTPETGYVLFPAKLGGWQQRRQYAFPLAAPLIPVPVKLAFNTGFPASLAAEVPEPSLDACKKAALDSPKARSSTHQKLGPRRACRSGTGRN